MTQAIEDLAKHLDAFLQGDTTRRRAGEIEGALEAAVSIENDLAWYEGLE